MLGRVQPRIIILLGGANGRLVQEVITDCDAASCPVGSCCWPRTFKVESRARDERDLTIRYSSRMHHRGVRYKIALAIGLAMSDATLDSV